MIPSLNQPVAMMLNRLRRLLGTPARFPPAPARARHTEPSMLFSADDEPGRPSPALIELALKLADRARGIDLGWLCERLPADGIRYPEIWPGEHYRLLAAAVDVLRPRLVIEIGTAEGLSALAMRQYLPPEGRLVTFDVVPWRTYPDVRLTDADFADGRLEQRVEDLSDPAVFAANAGRLRDAGLVFMDAAKDGQLEQVLLDHFETLRFVQPSLFILDDVRLWNMLRIWRSVTRPKLDLTSLGHWSGTGLIEWN
jgi:predicted O-methyltransferase YrrM